MRGGLIFPLLAALAASGCLVSQEMQEERDPGHTVNDPPRILAGEPRLPSVVTQRGCGELRLSANGILDLDADDTVELRWFVDYDPKFNSEIRQAITLQPDPRGGAARIPSSDEFVLSLDGLEGRRVIVEALVSDGFIDDEALPNRAVASDKSFDALLWMVQVNDVLECPR